MFYKFKLEHTNSSAECYCFNHRINCSKQEILKKYCRIPLAFIQLSGPRSDTSGFVHWSSHPSLESSTLHRSIESNQGFMGLLLPVLLDSPFPFQSRDLLRSNDGECGIHSLQAKQRASSCHKIIFAGLFVVLVVAAVVAATVSLSLLLAYMCVANTYTLACCLCVVDGMDSASHELFLPHPLAAVEAMDRSWIPYAVGREINSASCLFE